jgi:hypothetical protein
MPCIRRNPSARASWSSRQKGLARRKQSKPLCLPLRHRRVAPVMIYGITRNFVLLFSVALGVVTIIEPVVAPLGTLVLISAADTTVKFAAVLLKLTLLALFRFVPKM